MAYEKDWYIKQQVLLVKCAHSVSYADAVKFDVEMNDALEASSESIHLILDASHLRHYPLDLKSAQAVTYQKHSRMGNVILVSQNHALYYMGAITFRFLKKPYHVSPNLTEARAYLKQREPHLLWSHADESLIK